MLVRPAADRGRFEKFLRPENTHSSVLLGCRYVLAPGRWPRVCERVKAPAKITFDIAEALPDA